MLPLAVILLLIALPLFVYAVGQTAQLFFGSLIHECDDDILPSAYFVRHRRFIINSAVCGYLLAAGYILAALDVIFAA